MCGISGIYHFNNSKTVSKNELTKMRDTLVHRGPNGGANFISKNNKVGLSQRRLAIIDLSDSAKCPMANGDETNWITYNGEVYNFKPLREELSKLGYKFKTQGDTEVILHGYEEWGAEIVKRLNGMFAFAIWDEKKRQLFAARDHMGIKPFFYAIQDGSFLFGSEIKAILAYPEFKKELNEQGVLHYLTFGSSPAPYTLFKNINKLPAAHTIVIREGGIAEIQEYWNVADTNNKKLTTKNSEQEYIEETRVILRDSIKKQMVSDVPFGCFLSGGIDSSTNAALMTEALGKPVETFSVGYKNFDRNEFEHSRKVAKFLGTTPHEILLDESHLREFLPKYAYHADDPNSDQVCFPLFFLSKLTHDSDVTVVQIGEGSDEIFAGYDQYLKALRLRSIWKNLEKLPQRIKDLFHEFGGVGGELGKEYMRRLALHQEPFWGLATAFGGDAKCHLLKDGFKNKLKESSYEVVKRFYEEIKSKKSNADYLTEITYVDLKHRLPEFLLPRADKMTMAHSIEGRVPFLDARLVELAFNMPTSIKIKNGDPKYILKQAVKGIIPDEIINRKKQGFGNPLSEWLRSSNPISKELTSIIFNSKLKERNVLNYDYVKNIIQKHESGQDQNFRIWNLITLSLWYDYWLG